MLNSEISRHISRFPPGFRRDFDAHAYYTRDTRPAAVKLRALAAEDFRGLAIYVGELRDRPVGPHTLPMFELNFPRELLGPVLLWLISERRGLSVLVHEVTGRDPRDHSEGAIWLGERVELDASRFDP